MDDALSAPQHKKRKLRSESTDVRVELPETQPSGPLSDPSWLANHDTNERPRKPLKRQRTHSFIPATGGLPVTRLPPRKRNQAWSALPPLRIGTDQEDIGKVLHSATPGPSSGTLRPREYAQPKSAQPSMSAIKTVNMPQVGPVINRQTLKELDLAVILSNHQLRHDLLFDANLQFRPTLSPTKKAQADRYWAAVAREIEFGCTCTSFDSEGAPLPNVVCACRTVAPSAGPSTSSSSSITSSSSASSSSSPVQRSTIYYSASKKVMTVLSPSRIRPLLDELLEVILSVMQPLPDIPVKRKRRSSAPIQHGFEDEEKYLRSLFDPELIEQEIRQKVFDPSGLFEQIGAIIKCHCAPMRDATVDAIVAAAKECSPGGRGTTADMVKAVRACMDLLEYMKLDIANHELQALRPFIARSSGKFELDAFKARSSEAGSLDLTSAWIQAAHSSLQTHTIPHPSKGPIPYSSLGRNTQLFVSIIKGLTDLAFYPPVHSLHTITSPTSPWSDPKEALPGYPETTYLDCMRLRALAQNATDASLMSMFLLLFRQLWLSARRRSADDGDVAKMKAELRDIWVAHIGAHTSSFTASSATSPSTAMPMSAIPWPLTSDAEKWHQATGDMVLQIAARASGGDFSKPAPAPPDQLLQVGLRWAETNLHVPGMSADPASQLSTIMRDRLRDEVFDAAVNIALAASQTTLSGSIPRPNIEMKPGLETLSEEVMNLSQRIAKLGLIHCDAYLPLYESQADRMLGTAT